jgi:hypothetical protein
MGGIPEAALPMPARLGRPAAAALLGLGGAGCVLCVQCIQWRLLPDAVR